MTARRTCSLPPRLTSGLASAVAAPLLLVGSAACGGADAGGPTHVLLVTVEQIPDPLVVRFTLK